MAQGLAASRTRPIGVDIGDPMKFSLKALLGFMLMAAIAVAVVRSTMWRLTAKHDIGSMIRLGDRSHGYPVINAVGFFEGGVKVIVLHRVKSPDYDDGDNYRAGSHQPKWLNNRSFGPGRVFDWGIRKGVRYQF